MSAFHTADDMLDFVRPFIGEMARALEEYTLPRYIHAYLCPDEDGAVYIGSGEPSKYDEQAILNVDLARLRRLLILECVTVARRLRRNRSIGRYTTSGHQPAWSCHTSILTLAMMRLGGHGPEVLKLLGPGKLKPTSNQWTLYPRTLRSPATPDDPVSVNGHVILDGRIAINAEHRKPNAFTTRDGNEIAILVNGMTLPETAIVSARGMPLSKVLDSPLADLVPNLPVTRIVNDHQTNMQTLRIHVADHRMPIAGAPAGTDMSFVTLGQEQFDTIEPDDTYSVNFDPITLLEYDPSMHLARP